MKSFAYGGGRQALASLAPLVGIALNQGSVDAQEVLTQAADALITLAKNMLFKLERLPIVFAGGVFNVSPLLEERIRQEFPEAIFNRASSALSAARMALENL